MNDFFTTQTLIGQFEPKFTPEIFAKSILIVGLGGNGTHLAIAATRMGFQHIVYIDKDVVSESNLSRQVLYTKGDVGLSKAETALISLSAHNLRSEFNAHDFDIIADRKRFCSLVEKADLVFVVLDQPGVNLFAIDTCYYYQKPTVTGGTCTMSGLMARVAWMKPQDSPCLNCYCKTHPVMNEWIKFYKCDGGLSKVKTRQVDEIDARLCLPGGHPSMYPTACIGSNLMMCLAVNYFMGHRNMPRLLEFSVLEFKMKELELKQNQKCPTCSYPR